MFVGARTPATVQAFVVTVAAKARESIPSCPLASGAPSMIAATERDPTMDAGTAITSVPGEEPWREFSSN